MSFLVQFFITPFILGVLGKELFGVYTLINKVQGYMSLVDLRPTAILRFKLASIQTKNNIDLSRKYIGASYVVSLLLFPFFILLGYVLSIGFESYFKVSQEHILVSKIAIISLSVFIGLKSFYGVPEAIIRGYNSEFKMFYTEPIRVLVYSALVYVLLNNGFGILGIIGAIISAATLDYIIKSLIRRKLYPNLFYKRAEKKIINEFTGNGSWYLISSLSSQLINTFDVIIVGVIMNSSTVTIYALSKSILFRMAESISSILGAITSSIGHLISNNDYSKLRLLREQIFRFNLVTGVGVILYFIIFNKFFIALWVGSENFIGNLGNLFLCLGALFTLLCLTNELFLNALQIFKKKSMTLIVVALFFVILSYFSVKSYGLVGIAFSVMISKFVQLIIYEFILQMSIKVNFLYLLKSNYKIIAIIIFINIIDNYLFNFNDISWLEYMLNTLIFFLIYLNLIFFYFLNKKEKHSVLNFIKNKFNG